MFLLAPRTTSCEQPPVYRTGYSEAAPLDTADAQPSPVAPARPGDALWGTIGPHGYTALGCVPLPAEAFDLGSPCSSGLNGASIMYKLASGVWVVGEIIQPSADRRKKDRITGATPNYVVRHFLDPELPTLQLHSIHIWVTSPSVTMSFIDSQSLSQSPK